MGSVRVATCIRMAALTNGPTGFLCECADTLRALNRVTDPLACFAVIPEEGRPLAVVAMACVVPAPTGIARRNHGCTGAGWRGWLRLYVSPMTRRKLARLVFTGRSRALNTSDAIVDGPLAHACLTLYVPCGSACRDQLGLYLLCSGLTLHIPHTVAISLRVLCALHGCLPGCFVGLRLLVRLRLALARFFGCALPLNQPGLRGGVLFALYLFPETGAVQRIPTGIDLPFRYGVSVAKYIAIRYLSIRCDALPQLRFGAGAKKARCGKNPGKFH